MTELPAAHKSFYAPGEAVQIPASANTDGYWVLTREDLGVMMKY